MVNKYVAIDLETTGIRPKYDQIIEIGAVKVVDGEIVDTFTSYVNPARQISEFTANLTKIAQSDLDKASYIGELLEDLFLFLEDFPILGHNILFDYSFLKKAAVQHEMEFEKRGIDTLQLARIYLPEEPSKKLEALCGSLGITHCAHRALDDAIAAHELYQKMLVAHPDIASREAGTLVFKSKKEVAATPHQKERLKELIIKYQLEVAYDVERLTKNQASRYTDQILATFGR